jgi:PAS domain S-box-containing protein
MGGEPTHRVQFYEHDAFLVDVASRFIGTALATGDVAVSIASTANRALIEAQLRARAVDVAAATLQGRYVPLDAAEMLSHFMRDGWPDAQCFDQTVGGAIASAAARHPRSTVHGFGEMVALLWAEGKHEAALRVEELWNGLAKTMSFSLLCAYPMRAFRSEAAKGPFLEIVAAHAHVIPTESYGRLSSEEERLRVIAELQQQAAVLEASTVERRRIEEAHAEFVAIVESSNDAIVGKTLDGIVTSWNRSAERLFGYTAGEMIGESISCLMPPERPDDFPNILSAIRRGERIEHFETQRVRKDGRRIDVSLTVSPIKDAAGRIIGASKIARDVTDRRRAEAEREELRVVAERARAAAETANRAKDEFLAMLSHELRNPLAAVRNAIVAARVDGPRRERALDVAYRQSDHLGRLVDDLLDAARVTQGKITLRRQRVRFATIVERAVETMRPLVEERAHALTVSLDCGDVQVDADAPRLEQVIGNLVANAANYTERGGTIEVTATRDGSEVALCVRDNGAGIAPELLPRIFDLFTQGARSLDRAQAGLGIGLTVVRKIVELHGGRVEARSAGLGHGAELIVHLVALGEVADDPSTPSIEGAHGSARVLVVEDHPDIAESMMMLMEVLGHRVQVVHDGESALGIAQASPPDVILVDIGLPGIDGYEVARRVRQHPALQRVVLVALTGYGCEGDRQRALASGFDHHLVKPVDPDALQALVARIANTNGGAGPSIVH